MAIVGAGVSGLSAAWALNEYSAHEVHLFEPGSWIGGHTNTVSFTQPSSTVTKQINGNGARPRENGAAIPSTAVDTGFIVFNKVTYPNFLRFLRLTGIEILDSDMSFSVTRYRSDVGYGAFEWAGGSPGQLFAQATNLLNPSHWRMVWDILRFNQQSIDFLRTATNSSQSIGEWLDERKYSAGFRRNYLIPMTASIWSTAPETALSSFPAVTLLRFMHNHHLLQVLDRPQWLTVKGGSKKYVERILSRLPNGRVHQGTQHGTVIAAWQSRGEPHQRKWSLKLASGQQLDGWDKVIFACHADTTVDILEQGRSATHHAKGSAEHGLAHAYDQQQQNEAITPVLDVLRQFRFSENHAVLHCDTRLMPVRRTAWSAWNFLAETITASNKPLHKHADVDRVSLTYWMNLLQSLPESTFGPILVTLNPTTDPASPYTPRAETVVKRQSYTHPIYTADSVAAQHALRQHQGKHGAYFIGAWTNYGFHEDGFSSGLRAANDIPDTWLPFDIRDAERTLPSHQLWSARFVGVVDSIARWWIVQTPAHMALVFVLYAVSLLHLALRMTMGLAPRSLTRNVGTVQTHLREAANE